MTKNWSAGVPFSNKNKHYLIVIIKFYPLIQTLTENRRFMVGKNNSGEIQRQHAFPLILCHWQILLVPLRGQVPSESSMALSVLLPWSQNKFKPQGRFLETRHIKTVQKPNILQCCVISTMTGKRQKWHKDVQNSQEVKGEKCKDKLTIVENKNRRTEGDWGEKEEWCGKGKMRSVRKQEKAKKLQRQLNVEKIKNK